jgi:ribose transport system permease protein
MILRSHREPTGPAMELEPPARPQSVTRIFAQSLTRSWIFLFLLGLVGYFSLTTPDHAFFQTDNFKAIALDTSVVLLLAIGETFVIATAGIDLSIGGILLFSGVAGGLVMLELSGTEEQTANLQYPNDAVAVPVGIAVALACGIGWGLVNGLLVTRLRMPSFIVTLGTLGISFGAADLLSGGTNIVSVPTSLQDSVGNGKIFGIFVPVLIALVIAISAHIVLRYTRFGRYTEAVGSNAEGARRAGIAVDRHLIKVYTLAGLLAGLAAVIDLARFGTMNLAAHNNDNLNAIAAVVIGGTSLFGGIATIFGTVVGAFIPTVLQNGLVISAVNPFWQQVVVGAMIIVAVYFDQLRRRRLD